MTDPIGSETNARGIRHYIDPDTGIRHPSVTTLLGVMGKDYLKAWYAKEAALRALDMHESGELATYYQEHANGDSEKLTLIKRENLRKHISKAAPDKRDAGGVRGDAVHKWAELYMAGRCSDVPEEYVGYVNSYLAFMEAFEPQIHIVEQTLLNTEIGYGGATDAIATIPEISSDRIILDWKTANNGPDKLWALQMAAYSLCDDTLYLDAKNRVCKAPVAVGVSREKAAVVRILKDGYELWEADLRGLRKYLVACRVLYPFYSSRDRDHFKLRRGLDQL